MSGCVFAYTCDFSAITHRQRDDYQAGPRDVALEGQVAEERDRLERLAQALAWHNNTVATVSKSSMLDPADSSARDTSLAHANPARLSAPSQRTEKIGCMAVAWGKS